METELVYGLMSVALMALGLYAVIVRRHMIRRLLAVNIFGSGVFVLFVAFAARGEHTDPVPQAMVLTGIVIAISATALGLVLIRRIYAVTESTRLSSSSPPAETDEEVG